MVPLIYTYTGRRVNPLNPDPADLVIQDIAHALALCNRFAGHTRVPLSVAQHSVHAARMCLDTPHALQALLHDASEAYLGDVTKWLKGAPAMAAYREAEDHVQRLIYRRFGCDEEQAEEVGVVDRILVRYEMQELMPGCTVGALQPEAEKRYPPLTAAEIARVQTRGQPWYPWSWQTAEREFLHTFQLLTRRKEMVHAS